MELIINANNENFSRQARNLKSSRTQILFISNNWDDRNCFVCGSIYAQTLFGDQKYCKSCLLLYIDETTTDNDLYLDVAIRMKLQCRSKHKNKELLTSNIQ